MTARQFARGTARMKMASMLVSHGGHTSTRARMCEIKNTIHVYAHTHMCAYMRAPRAVRAVCGLQACGEVCGGVYARAVSSFIYLRLKND